MPLTKNQSLPTQTLLDKLQEETYIEMQIKYSAQYDSLSEVERKSSRGLSIKSLLDELNEDVRCIYSKRK